jgi:hypothetical protein
MATTGAAIDAPKTVRAAADKKALRDCSTGPAFRAIEAFCIETLGAKPVATAMTLKAVRMESFMVADWETNNEKERKDEDSVRNLYP